MVNILINEFNYVALWSLWNVLNKQNLSETNFNQSIQQCSILTWSHGDDRLARRNSEMRNRRPDVLDLNHLELAVRGQPDLNVPHNVVPSLIKKRLN